MATQHPTRTSRPATKATLATKATRTVHVPYTPQTVGARICPMCGLVEHQCVSPESQQRDVSEDRWTLTPLGQALLDGLRALSSPPDKPSPPPAA